MHRTIGYLSKRFVQIRPGEGKKVLLTFLYFFLIITAYYVIKPVSRSLVLGELGSRMVPYIDLICAVLMGPVVTVFARLVDRWPKPKLVSGSFWFVAGMLVCFWKVLGVSSAPWVTGAFYVWVAVLSVLVVTLFWLVANDLYHPREAKRLFGFIGSGGILGGIVGSSIAAAGARVIGTERLLLLSAGLILCSWLVVQRLWVLQPDHGGPDQPAAPAAKRQTFLADPSGFFKQLLQSRYLLLLVALVALAKIISTLVIYQFNPFIEQAFPDADTRTAFTGIFFGGMNVAAFIIQFGFTSWVLRRVGLRAALTALPAGLLVGTVALLGAPMLWLAAALELYDGSMNYSLQQTTKEMLYLPIDRSIRYKVKPFIDMVVFRFGKGIAALLGILLLNTLKLPPQMLGYVTLPLIGVWLLVAGWICRDYVATIRMTLQARAAARRAQQRMAAPADGGELFGSLTDIPLTSRKLELMDRLVNDREQPPVHVRDLLAELAAHETPKTHASELGVEVSRLKTVIVDPGLPMVTRRQAVRLLARLPDQPIVDYLFGMLMVEQDIALRQEAALGLIKLRLRRRSLGFPVAPIRRLVEQEVDNYRRIAAVASVYRRHHRGPPAADDPALALLRMLLEESVEQVFRLLMLLYRPEDIHLVYDQMRLPEPHLRADALELLDNLVDPVMRATLLPILDEDEFLSLLNDAGAAQEPTEAYRVLQEAIWDHNYWLSVTTLCAVGRLRLTTMRQELERASHHSTRLISAAAKAALYLATQP